MTPNTFVSGTSPFTHATNHRVHASNLCVYVSDSIVPKQIRILSMKSLAQPNRRS